MDLFSPVVDKRRQHPNFERLLKHSSAERDVLQKWSAGFVDRDGKFVIEFQTSFNSAFWEVYVFACLKELGLRCDFTLNSPDFSVIEGFWTGNIECVTAQNSDERDPEHSLTIEQRMLDPHGPSREIVSYEATIRLANSLAAKFDKFSKYYRQLSHVNGKPFILAVAPFHRPYFWIQRLDGITNVLYRAKLHEVVKANGTLIPLGYFRNSEMSEISAVLFSNVATYSKVIAMAADNDAINCFVTARYQHSELNHYFGDYEETLLDGLFLFHNPYARHPVDPKPFKEKGIAQIYESDAGSVIDIPKHYLLERTCLHFMPTEK